MGAHADVVYSTSEDKCVVICFYFIKKVSNYGSGGQLENYRVVSSEAANTIRGLNNSSALGCILNAQNSVLLLFFQCIAVQTGGVEVQ